MKKFILGCIVGCLCMPVFSQPNKTGNPFVKNYNALENGFGETSYAIAQDRRGIVYFGNNDDGVLEFDGTSWRKIKVPSGLVRSLATDSSGRVFVGSIGEFGMLIPNATGTLSYVSLSGQLGSMKPKFGDVWKIYAGQGKVYFCSQEQIFLYDYRSVKMLGIPGKIAFFSFLVNNRLYIGSNESGLNEFDGKGFKVVKGGQAFEYKDILVILPYDPGKLILATTKDQSFSGLYIYDTISGNAELLQLPAETKEYLKGTNIYYGIRLRNERYMFGTLGKGAFIMDKHGQLLSILDKKSGLQDDVVASLYAGNDPLGSNPLWLTLGSGISVAEVYSPVKYFTGSSGIGGTVSDIVRFNGVLYLATNTGVFYLAFDAENRPYFKQISQILGWAWSFLKVPARNGNSEKLLVGTDNGIYEIRSPGNLFMLEKQSGDAGISNRPYIVRGLVLSESGDRIYVAEKSGIVILRLVNGKWEFDRKKYGRIGDEIRTVAEDDSGDLWLGSFIKGAIRIQDTVVKYYEQAQGLPGPRDINVFKFNHKVLFLTSAGIYHFNRSTDKFEPDTTFGKDFANGSKGVFKIRPASKYVFYATCYSGANSWIEKLVFDRNMKLSEVVSAPYKRLPRSWMEAVFADQDSITWFGTSNAVYSFDEKQRFNYRQKYYTLIRKITIGQDSLLYNGLYFTGDSLSFKPVMMQPANKIPEIAYSDNNITFFFSSPYFENHEAIEYSYYLEGYRNYWSKWSNEPKAVFTNLSAGRYIFKVKARNIYGEESEIAPFFFTVLPPWYQTIAAYIVYIIVFVLVVWGLVKYNTRRLQLEKIRLEGIVKERTAEILKQKDEIETQRDQIIAQKKDITDSIRYASRIQRAVLPSEKVMRAGLPEHFVLFMPRDIVSGDFYWMTQKEHKIILVAADCTGHGVPGAFMSMLGMSFLNEIVTKSSVTQSNLILNELREHVITQLKQTGEGGDDETKDGMDLSLVVIDKKEKKIQFSGANNSMYVVRPLTEEEKKSPAPEEKDLPRGFLRTELYELMQINADKMPIGTSAHNDVPFSVSELPMIPGQALYILSDGYEDQFGGPMGKKFLSKVMKRLLLSIQDKPMNVQRDILKNTIEEWKGDLDQVDDILVIGLKIV